MATNLDHQIGFKKESTFGTGVTVDSFVEFNPGETLDVEYVRVQGNGLRVGQRSDYGDRWVTVATDVSGSFETDLYSKGMGKLIEAALGGTGTSTQASGAAYQQLFTPTTGAVPNSYTIQKGVVPISGATTEPHTFVGMVCTGFDLAATNQGVPALTFNWIGKDMGTATGLATASYASYVPLSFTGASIGVGGTLTVPTTTALSSGATANATVKEASLSYVNMYDGNGKNFGGGGKLSRLPQLGKREITGSLTVEYTDNTLRDLWIANTSLPLVLTYAHETAITGAYYPTFQIAIPAIKLLGDLPMVSASGEPVEVTVDFKVVDDRVAAHPFYVAIVTAETAI